MKQKLLFLLVIFTSITTYAQEDKKWSVEANYLIERGNDFLESYNANIELGVKYRFLDLNRVKIGASFNAAFLTDKPITVPTDNFSQSYLILQPKIFAELDLPTLKRFHPSLGVGYNIFVYRNSGTLSGASYKEFEGTNSGLSVSLGLSYDITSKLFIQGVFDYSGLTYGDKGDVDYSKMKATIFKMGLGFRF